MTFLAEVPRVREDFGYPPLVTPTSQIVGTQAVLNVLSGERYKMIAKESKGLLRGEYGKLPGKVNEEVRKKAIGDDESYNLPPRRSFEARAYRVRKGNARYGHMANRKKMYKGLRTGPAGLPKGSLR